ncbi:hypothetical protein [Kushneria marisflavi]|uniref:Uncharacterized protein n=1 Tax=Kushneria marisflavi TaxID=157779 RepID=A0A240UT23_9GAMM|nr:hypothetical protein [Kushneria marisflavi]ART64192.1 hypothetical protein B9H00_14975 [Kushneria marisflavi]RKD76647.1 hypothetical protein C8D96_3022 [Kushneria marisflavi]
MTTQTDSRRLKALTLSLSISAAMTATAVQAAPNDQQTIEALRAQLQQMQQRLDRLEQQQATSASSSHQEMTGNSAAATPDPQASQASSHQSLAQENSSAIKQMQQTEFSGQLQFNGSFNDWSEQSKDTTGDMDFGKFVLAVNGEVDDLEYDFEYRFYDGYQFLKSGWLGFNPNDNDTIRVGLVQTPFGNMEYGYQGWYGTLPYLAGFNDNQNAGVKWDHHQGPWDTSLAFFKSDNLGSGNEHYGANAIGDSPQGNSEENQLAARAGYTFDHGDDYSTQLNVSAKGGQLYNEQTNRSGDNWSAAIGIDGSYGNWRTMFQATTYEYNPKNPSEAQSGISDSVIQIGAFGFNYLIPKRGQMYTASASYSMDVDWGPVENLFFFNDFSYIDPAGDFSSINGGFGDQDDPMLNDLGVLVTAGPYFAWFDIITNKNGLNYFGSPVDNGWHTSIQTNFGINF